MLTTPVHRHCLGFVLFLAVSRITAELVRNNAGDFFITGDQIRVQGDTIREVTRFAGSDSDSSTPEDFRILQVDREQMLVGARNRVYVISLTGLVEVDRIDWPPSPDHVAICKARKKNEEECQNYIRVIVKRDLRGDIFVCGTNAYNPWCRTYAKEQNGYSSFSIEDQKGLGTCPFDPSHNTTAIFTDQRLFTATVTDFTGVDALIHAKSLEPGLPQLRTEMHSSEELNSPNFVSSYEYDDKVYFFFRETAVEATNCRKTVYSRVARVCKNDQGGDYLLKGRWTSFFKARLNCSVPGDYPFYFDEIESTSDIGLGNYMPSITMDNRTHMVYAVFNTPQNSIHGSAVCAFQFHDILQAFEGPFKHQNSWNSNWLPIPMEDTPKPHPGQCSNGTLSDQTLNFVKEHPLMDRAVPAFGGKPVLIHTSFDFRLSVIAVDWQVYAADNKRYDVLFIGTTDGRVIKAINKGPSGSSDGSTSGGPSNNMNTVVIEDIKVFEDGAPVVDIQVHRQDGRLMVVSKYEIKSILLQRCHLQDSCSACVAIQDPYCSWHDGMCRFTRQGLQSIDTATHHRCPDSMPSTKRVLSTRVPPPSVPTPTCLPCPACPHPDKENQPSEPKSPDQPGEADTSGSTDFPGIIGNTPVPGAMKSGDNLKYASHDLAMAIIFTMILTLIIGFILGYIVSERRILPYFTGGERCSHRNRKNNQQTTHHHHHNNSKSCDCLEDFNEMKICGDNVSEKNLKHILPLSNCGKNKKTNDYDVPHHLINAQQTNITPNHLYQHHQLHNQPAPYHHQPAAPPHTHQQQTPHALPMQHNHIKQNSLSSLDNNSRSNLNMVFNDISGGVNSNTTGPTNSTGLNKNRSLNENNSNAIGLDVNISTPNKVKNQVYL